MFPSRFSLKGIVFLIFFLFSFLVCGQVLKGLVYPLAIKREAHNILDLVHPKECVTLWCS